MWIRRWPSPRNRRLPEAVYREAGRPCFITVRAYERLVPFVDPDLNRAVVEILLSERIKNRCEVYAYCLMRDHVHFLAAPLDEAGCVLRFTDRFKGRSTREAWRLGLAGKLWQPRFHDHVLRREEAIADVCEYILANPVRRGLVLRASDYAWGGLLDPLPQILH